MKTVTTVVTTTVLDSTICVCLYLGGSSQHVARLYTGMLLLELIPGATRPSTDINNNNIGVPKIVDEFNSECENSAYSIS